MMTSIASSETIIACNMDAIAPTTRDEHNRIMQNLFASVQSIHETEQGYRFQLPLNTDTLTQAMQWVTNERLCCPFITFTLMIGEHFSLELTGNQDVKTYLEVLYSICD